jgi:hypothetical protein
MNFFLLIIIPYLNKNMSFKIIRIYLKYIEFKKLFRNILLFCNIPKFFFYPTCSIKYIKNNFS